MLEGTLGLMRNIDLAFVEALNEIVGGEVDELIAFGMAAARRVGMRELVDKDELRPPRQHGVDIHLLEDAALVLAAPARDDFQPRHHGLGLLAAMGFENADDDVDALCPPGAGGLQHLVRLADPGRRAEKDLQASAMLAACRLEQGVRRGLLHAIIGFGQRHDRSLRDSGDLVRGEGAPLSPGRGTNPAGRARRRGRESRRC